MFNSDCAQCLLQASPALGQLVCKSRMRANVLHCGLGSTAAVSRTQTAWRRHFVPEATKQAVLLEASPAKEDGVLLEDVFLGEEAREAEREG